MIRPTTSKAGRAGCPDKRAGAGAAAHTDWAGWQALGRPGTFWGQHPKGKTLRFYLQGLKSERATTQIRAAVRKRLGAGWSGVNAKRREAIHDAIFEVMDEWESRGGGTSSPAIDQMRAAMNLVADDLGWQ